MPTVTPTNRLKDTKQDIKDRGIGDVHQTVFMLVSATMMLVPEDKRMYKEEIDRIFQPLERIILRHMPDVGSINPDYVDGYLFLVGIASYGQRIAITLPTARKPVRSVTATGGATASNRTPVASVNIPQTDVAPPTNGSTVNGGTVQPNISTVDDALSKLYAAGGSPVG